MNLIKIDESVLKRWNKNLLKIMLKSDHYEIFTSEIKEIWELADKTNSELLDLYQMEESKVKKRKYNSIEEFWKYSGHYPSDSEEDNGDFIIEIYLNSYESKEFKGNSFTECEEKLLEWANDEFS